MLSVIALSGANLSAIMYSDIMLSTGILSAVMLRNVMLSVVVLCPYPERSYVECHLTYCR
jgi:hypothetical protein